MKPYMSEEEMFIRITIALRKSGKYTLRQAIRAALMVLDFKVIANE